MFGKLAFGRKSRSILLSPLVAFALLSAPTVRAMQSVCDQCPPTCPMHRAAKPARNKPSCHNQGRMHSQHGEEREKAPGSALSRPPCGHSGVVPGVAMGPMILVGGIATTLYLPPGNLGSGELSSCTRFNDPPNPPPPILAS